jgi:hypothetical protein
MDAAEPRVNSPPAAEWDAKPAPEAAAPEAGDGARQRRTCYERTIAMTRTVCSGAG